MLDYLTTLVALDMGATEANPLLAPHTGTIWFPIYKLSLAFIIGWLLYLMVKRDARYALNVLRFAVVITGLVVAYNCLLISRTA